MPAALGYRIQSSLESGERIDLDLPTELLDLALPAADLGAEYAALDSGLPVEVGVILFEAGVANGLDLANHMNLR